MSQNMRGRALPTALAAMALGGLYWSSGRTNHDPLPMRGEISEKLETIGRQGGLPGKVNLTERDRGSSDNDPRNTRFASNSVDTSSKRSSTKTVD